MRPVVRTILPSTIKNLDRKERIVKFMGTRETPDRTGDIVRADGIDLGNFQKNPVFLWNHNNDIPAIGRILSVTREGNGLLFEVKFATPEVDEFADGIFKKFAEGFLSAVSIGFIPKDIEPIFSQDGMLMGLDILRSELLELSAVNIPAHQDALAAGLDEKYRKQVTEMDTKAVLLEDYRKTYEEEYDMKKLEELEATIKVLEESVSAMGKTVDEQAETIQSLMTLRETVDLSQKVMDTLNKSVVSLMGDKAQQVSQPGADSKSLASEVDPTKLMQTLDSVLSRFQAKAFTNTVKGDK